MMSNQLCFIDSNIWLYRLMIDPNSSEAEDRKRSVAIQLTDNINGAISTQVINEVCSVLLRKSAFTEEEIKQVIQSFYRRVSVIKPNIDILMSASDLRTRYNFSFRNGLIIASALAANANILYSEDMQDNLIINERLTIVNPFNSTG